MSQDDIEKRTGLLRCYISRVENGATVPSVPTLQKFAHSLEVPMYQLFFDGNPQTLQVAKIRAEWASSKEGGAMLRKFRKTLAKINEADLRLLLFMAQKMRQKAESAERTRKSGG